MYDDPTPVHADADTAKEWIEDELTWLDVYSKKPVDYLEAIARGETPKWDSEKGGYVYGDSSVEETSIGGGKPAFSSKVEDPQANDEPEGDLPF